MSDRLARTPSVVLAVASSSHDSLSFRFLILSVSFGDLPLLYDVIGGFK